MTTLTEDLAEFHAAVEELAVAQLGVSTARRRLAIVAARIGHDLAEAESPVEPVAPVGAGLGTAHHGGGERHAV